MLKIMVKNMVKIKNYNIISAKFILFLIKYYKYLIINYLYELQIRNFLHRCV